MDKQPTLEQIKTMLVLGKPAGEVSFEAFDKIEHLETWAAHFWHQYEQNFPEGSHQSYVDIFGANFEDAYTAAIARLERAQNLAKPVEVAGIAYTAVHKFDVLHHAWECDSEGAIVETPEGRKIVLSDHGRNYFATVDELKKLNESYCKAIDQTDIAISLIEEQKQG